MEQHTKGYRALYFHLSGSIKQCRCSVFGKRQNYDTRCPFSTPSCELMVEAIGTICSKSAQNGPRKYKSVDIDCWSKSQMRTGLSWCLRYTAKSLTFMQLQDAVCS